MKNGKKGRENKSAKTGRYLVLTKLSQNPDSLWCTDKVYQNWKFIFPYLNILFSLRWRIQDILSGVEGVEKFGAKDVPSLRFSLMQCSPKCRKWVFRHFGKFIANYQNSFDILAIFLNLRYGQYIALGGKLDWLFENEHLSRCSKGRSFCASLRG